MRFVNCLDKLTTPLKPGRKYGVPLDREILLTLASLAFAIIVAFVIYGYRWMDAVKENHLTHIQRATEQTAIHTNETNIKMIELSVREEMRHAQEMQAFEDLKTLVRTRGL